MPSTLSAEERSEIFSAAIETLRSEDPDVVSTYVHSKERVYMLAMWKEFFIEWKEYGGTPPDYQKHAPYQKWASDALKNKILLRETTLEANASQLHGEIAEKIFRTYGLFSYYGWLRALRAYRRLDASAETSAPKANSGCPPSPQILATARGAIGPIETPRQLPPDPPLNVVSQSDNVSPHKGASFTAKEVEEIFARYKDLIIEDNMDEFMFGRFLKRKYEGTTAAYWIEQWDNYISKDGTLAGDDSSSGKKRAAGDDIENVDPKRRG